jgi:hypothetical protein
MKRRTVAISGVLALAGAVAFSALNGCSGQIVLNLTKERTGNVTIVFINTASFTAGLSFGTWDAWDRSPGEVQLLQVSVDPHSTSNTQTATCARNLSVGTQRFVDRVVATRADETDTFIPEIFDTVVHFTEGLTDSDVTGLPTAGTAEGVELLLGIDYSCGDEIVFTFVEDPDAPGGYRIDHEVILDAVLNE